MLPYEGFWRRKVMAVDAYACLGVLGCIRGARFASAVAVHVSIASTGCVKESIFQSCVR